MQTTSKYLKLIWCQPNSLVSHDLNVILNLVKNPLFIRNLAKTATPALYSTIGNLEAGVPE